MGDCQNHGPFLGTLHIRCRIIIGIQKRTTILTTTHIPVHFTERCASSRFLIETSPSASRRNFHVGVSQNYGYLFGVPIIRIIVYWGLYWGPLILGNYHAFFRTIYRQGGGGVIMVVASTAAVVVVVILVLVVVVVVFVVVVVLVISFSTFSI